MSRYADLWPEAPDWVECITTNEDGRVVGWSMAARAAPEWHSWIADQFDLKNWELKTLDFRGPTPDWRDSLERRPRPANPTLCPHCGGEI